MLGVVLLCAFAGTVIRNVHGLECYTCTNVTVIGDCKQTVSCPSGSVCYKDYINTGGAKQYTLGCTPESNCPANTTIQTTGGSSALVGRSVSTKSVKKCSECCRSNNCNRQLCQASDPYCVNNADYDCNLVGSSTNLCLDPIHMKRNCRRFCGFCSMTDGSWASWSSWLSCDVTCGNGTQVRTRLCSDPPPSDGGGPCVGNSKETKYCSLDLCPVHGDWSQWSAWGSCSSTCDIGMQRRDRTCSNPYPSRNGDHCFGDARDDRICLPGACANGGWSTWNQWTVCSRSCGDGVHTRARTCDNPIPSIVGRDCVGSPEQTKTCNIRSCPDGGWSTWNQWTVCSRSCGDGVHTRARTCDNPIPSVVGRYCVGSPEQTKTCNIRSCPVKLSAFTATSAATSGSPLRFSSTIINEGNGYNTSTGIFTCTYPGLYYFTVDLTKVRDISYPVDMINAFIRKNGIDIIHVRFDPTDHEADKGSYSATGSTILHLVKGDTVNIALGGKVESWSLFSGFLFSPDP